MRLAMVKSLAAADGRRVLRDDFLAWMAVVPFGIALVLRFLAEPIRSAFGAGDGAVWLSIIETAFFAVVMPLVLGTLLGFMLLDEKDEKTLTAIRVTPVSLRGYLAWRARAVGVGSALVTAFTLPIAGLTGMGAWGTILTALAGAPLAASFGLVLVSGAANKIQGFAVVKLALVALLLPCIGLVLGGWWTWATAWLPSWWPVMTYDALTHGQAAWAYLGGSYLLNGALIASALRHLGARN